MFVASLAFGFAQGLPTPLSTFSEGGAFIAYGLVGLVIARGNRGTRSVGSCSRCGPACRVVFAFAGTYSQWASLDHPSAPGAVFANWLGNWAWVPIFDLLLTYPLLLFPDGKLPSPRWRPVAWAVAILTVAWSMAFAFEQHDYTNGLNQPAANPYTCPSDSRPCSTPRASWISFFVIAAFGACVAALVVRYRRSRGVEREQIRWLMFAGVLTVGMVHAAARSRQRRRRRTSSRGSS